MFKEGKANRDMLARLIAKKEEQTIKDSREMVDIVFEGLVEMLSELGEADIHGFGKFYTKAIPERNTVNPSTREPMVIPETNTVKFKPKKNLKDQVNNRV